jgi:D-glycero-D-manno-heptose 1,7-bisphosphate phosphatase
MLLTAAGEHEIDLKKSWMFGDSDVDIEAGRNAGCRTVHVVREGAPGNCRADLHATTLLDAVHQILALES